MFEARARLHVRLASWAISVTFRSLRGASFPVLSFVELAGSVDSTASRCGLAKASVCLQLRRKPASTREVIEQARDDL